MESEVSSTTTTLRGLLQARQGIGGEGEAGLDEAGLAGVGAHRAGGQIEGLGLLAVAHHQVVAQALPHPAQAQNLV
jgi:hypothetical protein